MDISKIEQHGYLKLIEFTLNNSSFSATQACEHCDLSFPQFNLTKPRIFIMKGTQDHSLNPNEVQRWELSSESYFNHLQYLEFKHAIDSSQKSMRVAIIAIIVSCVLTGASLYVNRNNDYVHNKSSNLTDTQRTAKLTQPLSQQENGYR